MKINNFIHKIILTVLIITLQGCCAHKSTSKSLRDKESTTINTTINNSTQSGKEKLIVSSKIIIECSESKMEIYDLIISYLKMNRILNTDMQVQNATILLINGVSSVNAPFKNGMYNFNFNDRYVELSGFLEPIYGERTKLTNFNSEWSILENFVEKLNTSSVSYE